MVPYPIRWICVCVCVRERERERGRESEEEGGRECVCEDLMVKKVANVT
jgi:hypothetical protein